MPTPTPVDPLSHDLTLLQGLFEAVLEELPSAQEQGLCEAVQRANHGNLAQGAPKDAASADLVRALSAQFSHGNLAERVHRLRRRRASFEPGAAPQEGSLAAVVAAAKARGAAGEMVLEAALSVRLQPVFTAHPTEATRRTLLRKEQRMAHVLLGRRPSGPAAQAADHTLQTEMATAWQTQTLTQAPTVADEVEHVTFYLTEVIYPVVPAFYEGMHAALAQCYGDAVAHAYALRAQDTGPWVRFGTWVGGDMDGNPNVGPKTLQATFRVQQQALLRAYTADLDALSERLSQSIARVQVSAAVQAAIAHYGAQAPKITVPSRYQDMPYRVLLQHIKARLQTTMQDPGAETGGAGHTPYVNADGLFADLRLMAESLDGHAGRMGGSHAVRRMMRRVATFGLHLAALDVRQDSLVHRQAVAALLAQPQLETADAAARVAAYSQALAGCMAGTPPWDAPARAARASQSEPLARMLGVFEAMVAARAQYGHDCLGLYIISMAQNVDDLLAVLLLAHAAGLTHSGGDGRVHVPLQVSPLFETVPDLQASDTVLAALCAHPLWQEHLAAQGRIQAVMLGYSDSNKESGFVASRAALRRAEGALVAVAQREGLTLNLFHGRGGTLSRGGSKPRQAILASQDLASHLRITEQGEVIHAKYGLPEVCLRTLELMGGALVQRHVQPPVAAVPEAFDAALGLCAEASRAAYRQLVVHTEGFFDYFRSATPIDVITRLRIGSRPPSRRAAKGLGDLRAIPWVFAWMQNRQMLPGWYGLGEGLAACLAEYGPDHLQHMYRAWPFFTHLIDDGAVGLAKCDLELGARYAALAPPQLRPIWDTIAGSHRLTVGHVLTVTQLPSLLHKEPVLAQGIARRSPSLVPLHEMQLQALERWRAEGASEGPLQNLLMLTVKGVAQGLHNTA